MPPPDSNDVAAGSAISLTAASRRWVFGAALATNFMAAIEGSIVATAMPTIVGDLGNFDLLAGSSPPIC